jgi:hypothetical protein
LAHSDRALSGLWRHQARIEPALSKKSLDLFNQPEDLGLFDTAWLSVEGRGAAGLARLGKSKDHRPDPPLVQGTEAAGRFWNEAIRAVGRLRLRC